MARKNFPPTRPPTNPVAKFAVRFNKAVVFQDKTRYSRKRKHKSREPFPIALHGGPMGKGSPWSTPLVQIAADAGNDLPR
ncbi:MAG TPA: hypothetical protein VI457_02070 [Methylococcaceae bacterium]|nr:hypothetical protein [Methylococcaceae bacterium]